MILLILYVCGALFFSFLCSIAEAVLLSVTPAYVAKLKKTSPQKSERIRQLRFEQVDQSLAAILTLNTIAHTVGAIVAGAKATHVFGDAWIGVFSAIITVLILFFSEIVPKTIGAVYWKQLVNAVAIFVSLLIKMLYPLIWLSELVTKLISKGKQQHGFNRDEFLAMAGLGQIAGHIDEHESRIFHNLFKLNTLKAKDVMTPRAVIHSLSASDKLSEVADQVRQSQFSRIPLTNQSVDDIDSFVLKTDVLSAIIESQSGVLSSFSREMTCVIEDMTLPSLLDELLKLKQHMVLVVNEYGDTAGLVTLEDVVETLLGLEIVDEADRIRDMQSFARAQWKKRAQARGLRMDDLSNTD